MPHLDDDDNVAQKTKKKNNPKRGRFKEPKKVINKSRGRAGGRGRGRAGEAVGRASTPNHRRRERKECREKPAACLIPRRTSAPTSKRSADNNYSKIRVDVSNKHL
jgi:hypothetical protein